MTFVAKKRPGQACEPWPNSRESGLFFFYERAKVRRGFCFWLVSFLVMGLEGEVSFVWVGMGAWNLPGGYTDVFALVARLLPQLRPPEAVKGAGQGSGIGF